MKTISDFSKPSILNPFISETTVEGTSLCAPNTFLVKQTMDLQLPMTSPVRLEVTFGVVAYGYMCFIRDGPGDCDDALYRVGEYRLMFSKSVRLTGHLGWRKKYLHLVMFLSKRHWTSFVKDQNFHSVYPKICIK